MTGPPTGPLTGPPSEAPSEAPSGRVVSAFAPDGAPEVRAGDDLADLVLGLVGPTGLADGDVVVVTSKVVAKAEGRVVGGGREEHVAAETVRVVARRGPTTIARTRQGLTLAAAGVDASNVAAGHVVLLPVDPDASARRLRAALQGRTGLRLGVVVTDTAGRAWRVGQTDLAVGAAGLLVVDDHTGRRDAHGNELAVTAPAVADEVAGLAELAQGKLAGRPVAVVRGRADLLTDHDGAGAAALNRAEGEDLFGYGAREAVCRALAARPEDQRVFGAPATAAELVAVLADVLGLRARAEDPATVRCPVASEGPPAKVTATVTALVFAHGWRIDPPPADTDDGDPGRGGDLRLRPATP